jgi:large subunit ribosomal protein L22
MITRAESRYIRLTPRKFRQIIPLVKGKNPEDAIAILMAVKKKASIYAIELLKSAIANTKRMQGIETGDLFISKMIANCGPQLKRFRAASMGRAGMIRKRTSHIVVELDLAAGKQVPQAKDSKQDASKMKPVKDAKEAAAKKKPEVKTEKNTSAKPQKHTKK